MAMAKLILILVLGLLAISTVQSVKCPPKCVIAFKCGLDYDPVWAIIDCVCRVIQNGCLLANENCQRQNKCLYPVNAISEENCLRKCPTECEPKDAPVCAQFPFKRADGSNDSEYLSFKNLCELNKYSCQNARPYLFEPTDGVCP